MAFFYEQGISSSDSTHRAGGGYGAKAFFYQQGISSGDTTHKAGGGYGAKPLTWHFLLARHIFKRHHSQSRWGCGAIPLTWHFLLNLQICLRHHSQIRWGIWSKTTNMPFLTKFANLLATPLTELGGDVEQNH